MTSPAQENQKGRFPVALIGAGPGDPGLITVLGLQRLREADVVVYDALANPLLLQEARPDATLVDAGKRAREHRLTQDQTNQLLVDHALAGRRVARLKGGDPYLFGRGAEEVSYLARRGVDCEVIPGVTSGIAAPAYAGIPVTHREIASTVTFVTGHEDPTKPATSIDYAALAALARIGGTICLYMGVGRLPQIAAELQEHGLDPAVPAAVIQWGTLPRQRVVRAAISDISAAVAREQIGPPAMVVVGRVAAIQEPGLEFFTRRPLHGQRVLVTRSRQQASQLREQLESLGAEVMEAPTIALDPPADWQPIDRAIRRCDELDWVILTSVNGVTALVQRLRVLDLDARHFAGVCFAAVGRATAEALRREIGINADFIPLRTSGDELADELIEARDIEGRRILLLRADIARPELPRRLTAAGAEVTELAVYETRLADSLPEPVLHALRRREIDWVTFASGSTVRNLVELLGPDAALLQRVKIASIGPVTSEAVRAEGLAVAVESDEPSIAALAAAVADHVSGKECC